MLRRKKPFISHVLPTSWLSKFKQMGVQKPIQSSPSRSSGITLKSPCYDHDDDDAFWRFSFGGEGKKSGGVLRSVLYDSDDEVDMQGGLGCRSCKKDDRKMLAHGDRSNKKFSDMVSDIRKRRELCGNVEGMEFKASKEKRRDRRVGKSKEKVWEFERELSKSKAKTEVKCNEPEEKVIWEVQRGNSDSRTSIEEDYLLKALNLEATSDNERKSLYISRELQKKAKPSCKVRVNSPRTASKIEICKIKALEDMKRAKMKPKSKKTKERTELESFAVVKCSIDPQKDFRESMVEMIVEKKIRRAEEFEELLACYLTLNSDEYHDLIIKVFRQVWLEVNHYGFGRELLNQHYCYD